MDCVSLSVISDLLTVPLAAVFVGQGSKRAYSSWNPRVDGPNPPVLGQDCHCYKARREKEASSPRQAAPVGTLC